MKKYFLKKVLLISSLVGVCFVFSCNRQCDVYNLIEPTLTAITIKDGSYFIYKDSVSKLVDSVYITNFSVGTNNKWCEEKYAYLSPPSLAACYNVNSVNTFSFFNRPEITSYVSNICAYGYGGENASIVWGSRMGSTIFSPITNGQTIVLNNTIYQNVQIENYISTQKSLNHTTYYSPTNGLIKITYIDTITGYHAWELQGSKIVK